ncbi:DUF7940 domain-containing protein [Aureimonas psammosilenae]|uniref:DUF7940 domain-containing protein n=1 Tax=Aureimonas psammosilenae TaxID=2495496 RepID=UPI00126126BC|nr:hypothetical protein [Aureimonas psammosilenae]
MQLRPDWRRVLAHAWSIRLWAIAILVQAVDVALPWFRESLPISDQAFGIVTLAFAMGGIVARLVPQKGITPCQ